MARPRRHLAYFVYRSAAGFLAVLPRGASGAVGSLAGRLAAVLSPQRRAVVAGNLAHVLGPVGPKVLDRMVRRAFASYGRYWADAARTGPRDAFGRKPLITIDGKENFDNAHRSGGVIVALPHIGLWDAGGLFALQEQFALIAVVEPAEDEALFAWFTRRRARLGLEAIAPSKDTAARLVTWLREGGVVALVADRDVVGDGIDMEFFGVTTKVPSGPAVLALRSGATIVPAAVYRAPNHRYRVEFGPPMDTTRQGSLREDVERVTHDMVKVFEALIARFPEQWHVFQVQWPEPSGGNGATS